MKRPTPRPLAGVYEGTGALSGYADDPALGVPPLSGYGLWDEFIKPPGMGTAGDLDWPLLNIGSAPNGAPVAPAAATECGVFRLGTNAAPAMGEGGALSYNYNGLYGIFPAGGSLTTKVQAVQNTSIRVFSGLLQVPAAFPTGVAANDALGLVADTSVGGSWFFRSRRGTGNTDIVSAVPITSWAIGLLRRNVDGSVSCYIVDASQTAVSPQLTLVGTFSTAQLPVGTSLGCSPLMVNSLAPGSQRSCDIDFFGIGGRFARS